MSISPDVSRVLELLEQATTLRVISEFLKTRGLPHSANSWRAVAEDRIIPALDNGTINTGDLERLLDEVENYQRAHVFLYRCPPKLASELIAEEHVKAIAKQERLLSVVNRPKYTDVPDVPTITSIRSVTDQGASLSVKLVETRIYRDLVSKSESGNRVIEEYEIKKARAVSLFRLSSRGILEVRFEPHASTDYSVDHDRVWTGSIESFFPRDEFSRFSLTKRRNDLWKKREELSEKLRYGPTRLRTDTGYTMVAGVPSISSNLASHAPSVSAIAQYMEGGGNTEGLNLYFRPIENGTPSAEVHVILSGAPNEIKFASSTTKADYEYVIAELTKSSS